MARGFRRDLEVLNAGLEIVNATGVLLLPGRVSLSSCWALPLLLAPGRPMRTGPGTCAAADIDGRASRDFFSVSTFAFSATSDRPTAVLTAAAIALFHVVVSFESAASRSVALFSVFERAAAAVTGLGTDAHDALLGTNRWLARMLRCKIGGLRFVPEFWTPDDASGVGVAAWAVKISTQTRQRTTRGGAESRRGRWRS